MMTKFVDAQMMHQNYPDTFYVPSREELDQIKPGDFVKVSANHERFWVKVIAVNAEALTGTVDNELVRDEHGLDNRSRIKFQKRHVHDILASKDTGKGKGKGLACGAR